jgi:DNA-binding IclR family transcriptional regulator
VLEMIAESRGDLRLSDLSIQLNIPKSTLLPILQTMCNLRYLNQSESGRYYPGTALFSMSAAFSDSFPVLEYGREELAGLVEQLGETCYCGTLVDGQVLYLDKVDSPQPLRMLTDIGKRLPAYATGIGKALLMQKSPEELARMYPQELEALTEKTITDRDVLVRHLMQCRQQGYAWEVEESTQHIRCFAMPVYKHGKIIAAISVAIPLFRYEPSEMGKILGNLRFTAERMGKTFEQTNAHFGESF